MNTKLTLQRLMKQQKGLENDPIQNALVTRDGLLNFHFCLYDLEGPYKGGIYHGLFQLHENYPFNAPKLFFYTPSGRFQINIPICTSFTNYHQQTWTSAWNVRSLILATISFMYSEQPSYGCCSDSQQRRVIMAKQSIKYNLKNQDFVKFFAEKLLKINKIRPQDLQQRLIKNQQNEIVQINQEAKDIQQRLNNEINQKVEIIQIKQNMNEIIDNLNVEVEKMDLLLDAVAEKRKKQQEQKKQMWIKASCYGVVIVTCYLVYKYLL